MRPVMSDATARVVAAYTGDTAALAVIGLLVAHVRVLDRHIDALEAQAHDADPRRPWPYSTTGGAA